MKITKKSYNKNVKKFATKEIKLWNKLHEFMDLFAMSEQNRDDLCKIIDDYILLNDDIMNYANNNDIDKKDFMLDIDNKNSELFEVK